MASIMKLGATAPGLGSCSRGRRAFAHAKTDQSQRHGARWPPLAAEQPGVRVDESEPGSSTTGASARAASSNATSPSRPTPAGVPIAAMGPSGPYITTSSLESLDGDFLERELVGPYEMSRSQVKIIHELYEAMMSCSSAFVAVALAGIALSAAAGSGEVKEAEQVLFSGVTVGDVASWVDSLLVAGLLRYGAESFRRVEETSHKEQQLAYVFQGINRLGLMFQQFAIAAGTVSVVTTLEAASMWPPLVGVSSALFSAAALLRSAAMWYVLSKYGTNLDNVDEALGSYRRCYQAAHDEALPQLDRLAIRVAFSYLQQFSAAGRRAPAASVASMAAVAASGAAAGSSQRAAVRDQLAQMLRRQLTSPGDSASSGGSASSLLSSFDGFGLDKLDGKALLKALPIIERSTSETSMDGEEGDGEGGERSGPSCPLDGVQYDLTLEEERLVQATQSSLNSAGLSLVLQSFATGLLVTAMFATNDVAGGLEDSIQVVNKAVAAELIFLATTGFDRALYMEGCDVAHLLDGLGKKGITKLFHNLAILAWAVVIAKALALLAPWEQESPLLSYIAENFSHQAADMVLEGQEVLVNMLQ